MAEHRRTEAGDDVVLAAKEQGRLQVALNPADADHDDNAELPATESRFPRLPPTQQFIIDPETGEKVHWDYGSLSPEQLEDFVPQCDQLCEMCQELAESMKVFFTHGEDKPEFLCHLHYGCLDDLRLSARAGCHFCGQLRQITLSDIVDESEEYEILTTRLFADIQLSVVTSDMGYSSSYLQFNLGSNKSLPATLAYHSSDHPQVLSLAKLWLHGCVQDHDQCRILDTGLPTAITPPACLIEVEATAKTIVSARLFVTSTEIGAVNYLTLSHCWGDRDTIKLTEATMQSYQVANPLARLPKTFVDALLFTAYLGYRYLWIDSLCIIQDSFEDCEAESRKMGDIYRYSRCTLAALKAKDSDGGLFSKHSERRAAPCQFLGSEPLGSAVYASTWNRRNQAAPQKRLGCTRMLLVTSDAQFWRRPDLMELHDDSCDGSRPIC